jgi:hypothetical protein
VAVVEPAPVTQNGVRRSPSAPAPPARAPRTLCEFAPLSAAEQRLVSELERGEDIVIADGQTPSPDPSTDRIIRASFIRYLLLECAGAQRSGERRIHEKGLRVVGAAIEGVLDLQSCVIGHDLVFKNCRFSSALNLNAARIEGLCLNGSVLPSLQGEWLVARGAVTLDSVEANGEIRLIGAKIRGQLDCDNCRISNPGRNALSLVRADIGGAFFLRGTASIDGLLNMTGARLRSIVDACDCWPKAGNLNLSGCVYESFLMTASVSAKARLRWLRLQRSASPGEFSPQPFEQCALVLRQAGHADDARVILIEKERLQRRAERSRAPAPLRQAQWLRDCLLGGTIRYGHAPMLALVWLLGFWILGTAVCSFVHREHAFKPGIAVLRRAEWMACAGTRANSWSAASVRERVVGRALPGESQLECFLRQPESRTYPRFSASMYALDTLLPVVSLGLDDYWSPDETKRFGTLGQRYVWFQSIVGWALTFLTVAGFSGLVKTK